MFLTKRRYVKNWAHNPNDKWTITVKHNGKVVKDASPVSYVEYEIGYWRKANQIHNWFVQQCAGGIDECQRIYVSREDLEKLRDTVVTVLSSTELVDGEVINGYTYKDGKETPNTEKGKILKDSRMAEKLLPTTSGFFFGGTDYDEWYWRDLEETKKILDTALLDDDCEYEYRASW